MRFSKGDPHLIQHYKQAFDATTVDAMNDEFFVFQELRTKKFYESMRERQHSGNDEPFSDRNATFLPAQPKLVLIDRRLIATRRKQQNEASDKEGRQSLEELYTRFSALPWNLADQ